MLFIPNNNDVFIAAVSFPVGAINEKAGESGISHFIEHLMFQCKKYDEVRKYPGVKLNAETTADCTTFFAIGPVKYWQELLDFLTNLSLNELNEERFQNEKKVVLEEMNIMFIDGKRKYNPILGVIHNANNSVYSNSIIGTKQDIRKITLDAVKSYHKKHYGNMDSCSFVVCAPPKIRSQISKKVGKCKPRIIENDNNLLVENPVIEIRHVNVHFLSIAFFSFCKRDLRSYYIDISAHIMKKLLWNSLRENDRLVYYIKSENHAKMLQGIVSIHTESDTASCETLFTKMIDSVRLLKNLSDDEITNYQQEYDIVLCQEKKLIEPVEVVKEIARDTLYGQTYNGNLCKGKQVFSIEKFRDCINEVYCKEKMSVMGYGDSALKNLVKNTMI